MSTLMNPRGPQAPVRSEVIEHIMRMVVPMRHEFGQSINVTRMIDDTGYAQSVFELVHASQNAQLRREALFVQNAMLGPRSVPAATL